MREALLGLIEERGYENTTVNQILDRARCGRATFYSHFRSKEDLLRSVLHCMRQALLENWRPRAAGPGNAGARLGFTLPLFREIAGYRRAYKAIVGREGGVVVRRQMRRMLTELVREDLLAHRSGSANASLLDLEVQYCVGALMSVLAWWMDHNVPLAPEEINAIYGRLTRTGLASPIPLERQDPVGRVSNGA